MSYIGVKLFLNKIHFKLCYAYEEPFRLIVIIKHKP